MDLEAGSLKKDFFFPGKGLVGTDGSRGDITITITTQPHPHFEMDGKGNVLSQARVPLRIMLKGGTIDVQTMYGIRTLRVPPGTGPLAQLLMPKLGPNQQGYQIVTVNPEFPSEEELKTHHDWQKINIDWNYAPPSEDSELESLRKTFSSKTN